jgi:sugar O-acyltransferase (sialic acid O-acetyltransferase NeuD family)
MTSDAGGDLVIVGAGGFGRETAAAVADLRAAGTPWRLVGYLDDDPALRGALVDGVPVLGGLTALADLPDARVVVSTGRPDNYLSRPRIVASLGLPPDRYATIIHPTASVAASACVGPGSVLLAHVAVTAAARIGSHVAVMPQVTVTHDCDVQDFATLASGVCLGGGVRVRPGAYLGAGALVREGRVIGRCAMAGMGAVVTRDIPDQEVWAGVPARFLRPAPVSSVPDCLESS